MLPEASKKRPRNGVLAFHHLMIDARFFFGNFIERSLVRNEAHVLTSFIGTVFVLREIHLKHRHLDGEIRIDGIRHLPIDVGILFLDADFVVNQDDGFGAISNFALCYSTEDVTLDPFSDELLMAFP